MATTSGILSALAVTLLAFVHAANSAEPDCYKELGCFTMDFPWSSIVRPVPAPNTPTKIDTRIACFNRKSVQRHNMTLWPTIKLNGFPFDEQLTTVFITHGFTSSGEESWLHDMKDAYLKATEANVCIVDWIKGAETFNYLQVASNTRIVAAEVSRFIKLLKDTYKLQNAKLHMIGHSLGAHVMGQAAKNLGGVGRITGLDVAQPGFEGYEEIMRLDKKDADFVDVIHTNGAPFFPNRGLGLVEPAGHVDFYVNGGRRQPGCKILEVASSGSNSLAILNVFSGEKLAEWSGCSHGRSALYFIESLKSNCYIWGTASTVKAASDTKLVAEACTAETCIPMGLSTPQFPARGVFAVTTPSQAPFCGPAADSAKVVSRLLSNTKLSGTTSSALKQFFKTA